MPLDHFDFLAPFYDTVIQPARVERFAKIAGLPASGILLDAGGGTGRIADPIRGLVDHLVIADASTGMLAQAQQKGLMAACAASERLPFADDAFERVIIVDVLHHVYDQAATIRELWRVLKPKGRLVIEEPDIRNFAVKLVAALEKVTLMRSHFLNAEKIAGLVSTVTPNMSVFAEDHTVWVVADKD